MGWIFENLEGLIYEKKDEEVQSDCLIEKIRKNQKEKFLISFFFSYFLFLVFFLQFSIP